MLIQISVRREPVYLFSYVIQPQKTALTQGMMFAMFISLTFMNHWANSADDKPMTFFFLISFLKAIFDISGKLSPLETVCMKCQICFFFFFFFFFLFFFFLFCFVFFWGGGGG